MKKNVLIINPPSFDKTINRDMAGGLGYSAGEGVVLPPIDLLNSVSTLKKVGYKVWFVDAIAEKINEVEYFYQLIRNSKIEVVILGMALPTLSEDCLFSRKLKSEFPNLMIVGKTGINYKNILTKMMEDSKADLIIFGECDLTIGDYIRGQKNSGCVRKIDDKFEFFPIKSEDRVENLDLLPVSSRMDSKYKLYKYVLLPGVVTTMQTSRGCPYPCGYYCPYPLVQGKTWRAMSVERIIKEIQSIKKLGIKNILFRDATFTLNKNRTLELCRKIKKYGLKWWCETRINVLDEELLVAMKEAGCKGINVGIETLDQELIIYQGKPGVSLDQVKRIRDLAKKIGLKLHFLMIIGLPDENIKSITNTFEYLIKLKPESVGFSTITPYPGTEMFEMSLKQGLIKNFDWNKFNGSLSNMKTKYLTQFDMRVLRWLLLLTAFAMRKSSLLSAAIIIFNRTFLKLWGRLKRS